MTRTARARSKATSAHQEKFIICLAERFTSARFPSFVSRPKPRRKPRDLGKVRDKKVETHEPMKVVGLRLTCVARAVSLARISGVRAGTSCPKSSAVELQKTGAKARERLRSSLSSGGFRSCRPVEAYPYGIP